MNIREQILQANDTERVPVDLPKWGSPKVFVKLMTGAERDDFESSLVERRGKKMVTSLENVRSKLAVRCLVDESGARVFSDEDADALGHKSCSELQKIFEIAQRLNRLTEQDLEELTKNSEPGPSAGSTSA